MKKLILIFALIAATTAVEAQAYKTAIGLRIAPSYGITLKHFVNSNAALEGIFSPRWQGVTFTGLYEYHTTAFKTPRMNWYFGIGGHIGFGDHHYQHDHNYYNKRGRLIWYDEHDHDDHSHVIAGVDMILGLEYTFQKLPLNMSLDWKPMLNLIGHQGIWYGDGGFSMRFAF